MTPAAKGFLVAPELARGLALREFGEASGEQKRFELGLRDAFGTLVAECLGRT
jgi:hypothetical protein